jgi:erythromycin esterase
MGEEGQDARQAAWLGVFGIWTGSAQTAPLWDYISAVRNSDRPLELAGFDCQFTGSASSEFLVDDLIQLARDTSAGISTADEEQLDSGLKELLEGKFSDENAARFVELCEQLAVNLKSAKLEESKRQFWIQQLTSMTQYCRGMRDQKEDLRDRLMAGNLIWLAKTHYPKKKIIVWAASFHIARRLDEIVDSGPAVNYKEIVPMGHTVHSQLGEEVFTVGFTAMKGRAGAWFRQPSTISEAPEGTLESLIVAAGIENGLIPLRVDGKDAEWLRTPPHTIEKIIFLKQKFGPLWIFCSARLPNSAAAFSS